MILVNEEKRDFTICDGVNKHNLPMENVDPKLKYHEKTETAELPLFKTFKFKCSFISLYLADDITHFYLLDGSTNSETIYGRIYFQQPSPNHIIREVSKLNSQASCYIKSCTNSPSLLLSSTILRYYPESAHEPQTEKLEF